MVWRTDCIWASQDEIVYSDICEKISNRVYHHIQLHVFDDLHKTDLAA